MAKRNLDIRQFTIHPRFSKETSITLRDIKNQDLYEILKINLCDFINKIDRRWYLFPEKETDKEEENENKRTIAISKIKNEHGEETDQIYYDDKRRCISGKLSTGLYGKGGFIIDENKNIVFEKKVNQALPKPFYFMICVPAHSKTGYLVTEKDGIYGFAQGFCIILQAFIRTYFPSLTITCQPFIEDQLISTYLKSGVFNEITLTTTKLTKELEESYGIDHEDHKEYTIELKITSKNSLKGITGQLKANIQNKLKKKDDPIIDFEKGFKEIGFDEKSTISIKSLYDGHQRTIQLNRTHPIRPLYKINVKIDSDGHSNFTSIENEVLELLESLPLKLFSNGN